MEETIYHIVENLSWDAKDKKQTVVGTITKKEFESKFGESSNENYIYESPDGGETIYRRKFNDYENRELVNR